MSTFTATQAEKDAASYLDWDDAALGRFAKHVACTLMKLDKDEEGLRKVTAASVAMMLVGMAFDCNATTMTLTLDGHTRKEIPTGDWQIIVNRIAPPKAEGVEDAEEQVRSPSPGEPAT